MPAHPSGTRGDNPLTRSFVVYGRVDAYVTALPYSGVGNPSGTFTVSGLPGGASIKRALLNLTDWQGPGTVSGTFGNSTFGPGGSIATDTGGGYTLSAYRFNVTPLVTGNGDYSYMSSGIGGTRSTFAGYRSPPDVITLAIRWYLRFGLSYRDVEELLFEGSRSTT